MPLITISLWCVSGDLSLFCKINFFKPRPLNLMASLVALVDSIINFVIRLLQTHLLICLDNQSPLTNVFKLFTAVYRLRQTIYNGFIVVN